MRKLIRILAVALCLVMACGSLVSCSGEKDNRTIKLSEVTHSVFYAPLYVAINSGFFKDKGIEVELSTGEGANNVMTAILAGSVDVGFAGPEASIYVYNEGKEDYPQVFAQMTKKDGSFLVGREPLEDFQWSDLAGSYILPGRKGGVPYMAFEYVLKMNGLEPGKDVILDDSIKFDLMAGAFTGGTGDYFTCFEPVASTLEMEGKGYIVASVGEAAGEIPYTAFFASKSYLEKNSGLVQDFVDAIYDAQQWVLSHTPLEIAEALQPSFPDSDLELLEKVVQNYLDIDAWKDTPVLYKEDFERLQDVMEMAGELDERAPYEDVVNNIYAEKAIS